MAYAPWAAERLPTDWHRGLPDLACKMMSSPIKVLVVEDAEEVREFLVLLLESEGFAVSSCDDADQALAMVRDQRPDLILADVMLGPTSGLDLLTRLRSDFLPPLPPVIVCSGFVEFEAEAMQRGASAFIPKPFQPSTIQSTIASILSRRGIAPREREEAATSTRLLRARAAAAARDALRRLAPRWEDLIQRSSWAVQFLRRYFGFGLAFGALLEGEELQIRASSDEAGWKPGTSLDLALVRDIMETNSALLVPDLLLLGARVRAPTGALLRSFAGVPLTAGSIGVGALCFVDESPHRMRPDAYSLLEAMGRRASALLSDHESAIKPLWTPTGFLTRDGLCVVLAAELSRSVLEPLSLAVFSFVGSATRDPVQERTAVAELGDERFAVLITRDREDETRPSALEIIETLARSREFVAGGLISIDDSLTSTFAPETILRAADLLLERAMRGPSGTIQHVAIRREQDLARPRLEAT